MALMLCEGVNIDVELIDSLPCAGKWIYRSYGYCWQKGYSIDHHSRCNFMPTFPLRLILLEALALSSEASEVQGLGR